MDAVGSTAANAGIARPAQRLSSPVLVGRDDELRALVDAVTRPPAVVVVEGEAGVGKTRLVEELLARPELRGRQRLVGYCHPVGEPFPLGSLVEALRSANPDPRALSPVAGALRPLLPELAGALPEAPEPLGDRRAERHRLLRAVRELLDALGETVLVLEDLHWADQATLELLRFLAPQLPQGLAVVCTCRADEAPEASPLVGLAGRLPRETGVRVTLGLLDRDHVGRLAGGILEIDGVSSEFADYVFECSQGLPFAVEETVRLLQDRRDLVNSSGLWLRRRLAAMPVPTAFRDSILERLGRLGADARRVVRAAAVLGVPADEETLAAVASLPDARGGAALADALDSGLLVELDGGRYGFRHALARQAVEDATPSPVCRRLHLRAARVLEAARPKPLARLAHHFKAAGDGEMWIRYAEAAADRAVSYSDDATAYWFLRDAIAVETHTSATRVRLAGKLAAHAMHCLAHEEAIDCLRPLLADAALPPELRGEIRLSLARLLGQSGNAAAYWSELTQAVDELDPRPELAARAMAYLALPWVDAGTLEEHLQWLERAGATANDRATICLVKAFRAVVLLEVGDPCGWQALDALPTPTAEAPAEEAKQTAWAAANACDAVIQLGHLDRARTLIEESLRLSADLGCLRETTYATSARDQLDWLAGEWDGLEARIRRNIDEAGDMVTVRADAEAVLGLLSLARGDTRTALELLTRLRPDAHGTLHLYPWATAGLARIDLARGRPAAAAEHVARGLDLVTRKDIWVWATDVAPVAVEALLATDRSDDAAALTNRFARGLEGRDAPAAVAGLTDCRALLTEASGDLDAAAQEHLGAADAWLQLPRPYDAARAHERAGRCMVVAGGDHQLLTEAMRAFQDLGAAWDAARVRRALRAHGVIPPHRRGRRGYGTELSPREREVAQFAGDGHTNREIANALFLSPKTVEKYLGTAMRKLGVKSRTELGRAG
jgi:DNA-binding CsgD family transcriptional regulator/tetratricopeptide (TPR) repeat protein